MLCLILGIILQFLRTTTRNMDINITQEENGCKKNNNDYKRNDLSFKSNL